MNHVGDNTEKVESKQKDNISLHNNGNVNRNIKHKYWSESDERQKRLNYAYQKGGKDFVLTILAENGTMGIDRKSGLVGANGYSDYGICQVNIGYHPEVLSDGTNGKRLKDWFYNPYKQIDYCHKLYSRGVVFYGFYVRHKVLDKILF